MDQRYNEFLAKSGFELSEEPPRDYDLPETGQVSDDDLDDYFESSGQCVTDGMDELEYAKNELEKLQISNLFSDIDP